MIAALAMAGLVSLFFVIVWWGIFSKAGRPGWAVLIPLYNLYVYTQIVKRPKWWMLLYLTILIPDVKILMSLLFGNDHSHKTPIYLTNGHSIQLC